jgi:hypothetical protein
MIPLDAVLTGDCADLLAGLPAYQRCFLDAVARAGGLALVVTDLRELVAALTG